MFQNNYILQTIIFGIYVRFRGCIPNDLIPQGVLFSNDTCFCIQLFQFHDVITMQQSQQKDKAIWPVIRYQCLEDHVRGVYNMA